MITPSANPAFGNWKNVLCAAHHSVVQETAMLRVFWSLFQNHGILQSMVVMWRSFQSKRRLTRRKALIGKCAFLYQNACKLFLLKDSSFRRSCQVSRNYNFNYLTRCSQPPILCISAFIEFWQCQRSFSNLFLDTSPGKKGLQENNPYQSVFPCIVWRSIF